MRERAGKKCQVQQLPLTATRTPSILLEPVRSSRTTSQVSVPITPTTKSMRLTQVVQGSNTTETYSYDPVGNRTASLAIPSYTVNSSNELRQTPTRSLPKTIMATPRSRPIPPEYDLRLGLRESAEQRHAAEQRWHRAI